MKGAACCRLYRLEINIYSSVIHAVIDTEMNDIDLRPFPLDT